MHTPVCSPDPSGVIDHYHFGVAVFKGPEQAK